MGHLLHCGCLARPGLSDHEQRLPLFESCANALDKTLCRRCVDVLLILLSILIVYNPFIHIFIPDFHVSSSEIIVAVVGGGEFAAMF